MAVNFLPQQGTITAFLWNNGRLAGTGHFNANSGDVFSADPEAKMLAFRDRYIGDQASAVRGPEGQAMTDDLFTTYRGGNLKFPPQGENEGPLGAAMRRAAQDPNNPWHMTPSGDGFPTPLEILDACATFGYEIIKAYPAPGTGGGDNVDLRRKLADCMKAREVADAALKAEREAYVTLRGLLVSVLDNIEGLAAAALERAPGNRGGIPARTLHATGKALEALAKQAREKLT